MENQIKVYIKVNEDNEIIEINSSAFLQITDGWTEIDEGVGDRFTHAQHYYFEEPIKDLETGVYCYRYIDGNVIENPDFEQRKQDAIQEHIRKERIEEIKKSLAEYDYIGVKIATGRATVEEYADQIRQMSEWANEINMLSVE